MIAVSLWPATSSVTSASRPDTRIRATVPRSLLRPLMASRADPARDGAAAPSRRISEVGIRWWPPGVRTDRIFLR